MDGVERARFACAALLVCVTPLVIFTPATDQFISPKYDWIAFWTGALLLLSATRAVCGRAIRLRWHAANGAIALWVAWNAASILWARSRSLAWDDVRQWITLALAAVLIVDVVGGDRRRLIRFAWGLCLSATLTAAWTLWQDFARAFFPSLLHVQARLPDWRGYLSAGFGNTGHIADFIALTFASNVLLYLNARRRWAVVLAGTSLTLGAAAMAVCWSVHSNAGVILAALVAGVGAARRFGAGWFLRRADRLAVIGVLFASVVAFYMTDQPLNPHRPSIWREAFASERWKEGGSTRLAIWAPALHMAAQHRFLGVGAGNFSYVFPSVVVAGMDTDPRYAPYAGRYTNAAHNEPLQAWCELGVVGLLALLLLAATPFYLLAERRHSGGPVTAMTRLSLFGFLVAFAVHAQMSFNLQLPVGSLLFLLAVSLSGSLRDRGEIAREGPLTLLNDVGPFTFEIQALRMRKVRSIGVCAANRRGVALLIGLAGAACLALWIGAGRRLASDCEYAKARYAREQAYRSSLPVSAGSPVSAIDAKRARTQAHRAEARKHFERALELDPNHHDCRSAFVTFLMERGSFEEALRQLSLVMRRLDSPELYERRATCASKLGDEKAAVRDWLIYYDRLSFARAMRFEQLQQVLSLARTFGLPIPESLGGGTAPPRLPLPMKF